MQHKPLKALSCSTNCYRIKKSQGVFWDLSFSKLASLLSSGKRKSALERLVSAEGIQWTVLSSPEVSDSSCKVCRLPGLVCFQPCHMGTLNSASKSRHSELQRQACQKSWEQLKKKSGRYVRALETCKGPFYLHFGEFNNILLFASC